MKATVLLKLVQIKCIFSTSSYIIFLFDVILNLFVPFFYPLLVISCEGHLILTAFTMSWEKTKEIKKKIVVKVDTGFWLASTIKVNYRRELHARSKAETICFQTVTF